MSWLLSCFFMLIIAYNTYQSAKRSGQWSWKEFVIVIVALVAIPLLVAVPLMKMPWTADRPGLATLLAEVVILLAVCALAYFLRKFFPNGKKSGP